VGVIDELRQQLYQSWFFHLICDSVHQRLRLSKAAGRLFTCVSPSVPHGHRHTDCHSPFVDGGRLFDRACKDRRRVNGLKFKKSRFRLDIRKKFFMMRLVEHWNKLPREVVDTPSLEIFKVRLDRTLSNLILSKTSLLIAWGLD